jgi:hypothetical protein
MSDTETLDSQSQGTYIPGESAPAPQSQPARDDAGGDDDITDKARSQGWVPKDEYRGDPEKWRSADEFVKRGEEIVPILKERTATLAAKLKQQEVEYADRFARLEKMSEVALERQRQQLESAYSSAKRQAVEIGDVARFDQLEADERKAMHYHEQQLREAAPQRQGGYSPEAAGVVAKWEAANPWFRSDDEMGGVATLYSQKLAKERPGITIEENLKSTDAYMRKRYPDKFGPPTGSASVEGGGRMPSASTSRGRGAADLPPDAQKMGEKFVRDGLFKNISEYAKDYWSQ